MKRFASVVSALVLTLGFVGFVGLSSSAAACVSSGSFAGGDGSFGDPYQIATAGQLQYFANHQDSTLGTANAGMVNDRIVLTADIDMAGCAFTPQYVSVPFKGTLDGQSHTISNLSVSKPSSSSAGLFSTTGAGAIIKDLTLQSPTVSALSYVGALVGEGLGTDLVNITVLDATITGSGSSVGGIAGKLSSQSGRTTDSLIVRDSAISGGSSAGGLFGLLTQGTLNEDRTEVRMYAKDPVGVGKVQFKVNGREIAWVRAVDETDPKLWSQGGSEYLLRRVQLAPGKNRFEIWLNGVRIIRSTYKG